MWTSYEFQINPLAVPIGSNLFKQLDSFHVIMAQIGVRKGNVRKLSISISEISADWIESQVESQKYRNISHAVESLIREKITNAQT